MLLCWFGPSPPYAGPPSRLKFRLFFSPLPPPFRSFCLSLGVFSLNFGGVFEGRCPQMCPFWLSGCRVKPWRREADGGGRPGIDTKTNIAEANFFKAKFQSVRRTGRCGSYSTLRSSQADSRHQSFQSHLALEHLQLSCGCQPLEAALLCKMARRVVGHHRCCKRFAPERL